jgi:hypothetical protein
VVKNELGNGCTQYLIKSQADCGGGGVYKNLDTNKISRIDDTRIVNQTNNPVAGPGSKAAELEQGDWIRENSDPPWEMPWVAMPPETAWDPEAIPEMAVCFRFAMNGEQVTKVFHRTLLYKYIPMKGVTKAILRCFRVPEMPSLTEFFKQYHAQRRYLSTPRDAYYQRRAIEYAPTQISRSGEGPGAIGPGIDPLIAHVLDPAHVLRRANDPEGTLSLAVISMTPTVIVVMQTIMKVIKKVSDHVPTGDLLKLISGQKMCRKRGREGRVLHHWRHLKIYRL